MNITWITRSFLDYRVPVYRELDRLCGHALTVIYNGSAVPERIQAKAREALGSRAQPLSGEKLLYGKNCNASSFMANSSMRIPYQPGLLKAILATRPDVLVSDGFFQWTYAPLLLRAVSRIPHAMCYERTCHTERNAGKLRTFYRKFAMRYIDAIDANGRLTGEYLSQLGYPPERITYGHMAGDTIEMASRADKITNAEKQALRTELRLSGTVFLYVGQLIPRKGVKELMDGWRKAAMNNATLLIVGDGPMYDELQKTAPDNVRFSGNVSYDSLAPYYAAADCFVISTLEDNWSLVVPEAMACGLPVMCSCFNGCHPELVHPENGWVFNPLDMEKTASLLRKMESQKARFPQMGIKSREIIAQYSPQNAAQSIYDACLIAMNHIKHRSCLL